MVCVEDDGERDDGDGDQRDDQADAAPARKHENKERDRRRHPGIAGARERQRKGDRGHDQTGARGQAQIALRPYRERVGKRNVDDQVTGEAHPGG